MTLKTKKRKSPTESATKYKIGTKKLGNDGNMWVIISTQSGTHRWKKIASNTRKKSHQSSTIENKTKDKENDISLEQLKKLKKKYSVSTNGTKKDIAEGLWRVRGRSMETRDIEMIVNLLHRDQQTAAEKLVQERKIHIITDYKGMWKPLTKPISKMSREELIHDLRLFRNAWERITTRNQDLSNERLNEENTDNLRGLIKFYYSNQGKMLAEDWLRDYK